MAFYGSGVYGSGLYGIGSSSGGVGTVWKFSPPTVNEATDTAVEFYRLWRIPRGITVLRNGGVYTQHRGVTTDEIAAADRCWLGGYIHVVSSADAADLTANGYGPYLTSGPA